MAILINIRLLAHLHHCTSVLHSSDLSYPYSSHFLMSFPTMASFPGEKHSFSGQSYDDLGADFFDQFLTFSPVDEGHGFSTLPHSTLVENSISEANASSSSLDSSHEQDKWQSDSWLLPETPFPDSSGALHFYSELSGRAAISDSELLSLEGITLQSPLVNTYSHPSVPCSPTTGSTSLPRKKRITACLAKTLKTATSNLEKALRTPIRKIAASPNFGRGQSSSEIWGQKLEALKFSFDFGEKPQAPLSPPSTARIPTTSEFPIKSEHDYVDGMGVKGFQHFKTPQSTPVLDSGDSRRTSSQQPLSNGMHLRQTPNTDAGPNQWSQLPRLTKSNGYPTPSMYGDDAPLWWNHASTAPMAQPSPTALHINPQRATRSLANQLHNDISYRANKQAYLPQNMANNGLMIHMPGHPTQQQFLPPRQPQHLFSPHLPQFNDGPRQQYQPRPRRKSRSGSSDSESPSPKSSPAYHVRKRRTTKNKRPSSRTPTLGGAIDFVNFTPNDSRKILTGVAPSGSSKTKARREKEAMEKRRKLSQAALRAVREAGGDVDSLVEQGLLV